MKNLKVDYVVGNKDFFYVKICIYDVYTKDNNDSNTMKENSGLY